MSGILHRIKLRVRLRWLKAKRAKVRAERYYLELKRQYWMRREQKLRDARLRAESKSFKEGNDDA